MPMSNSDDAVSSCNMDENDDNNNITIEKYGYLTECDTRQMV